MASRGANSFRRLATLRGGRGRSILVLSKGNFLRHPSAASAAFAPQLADTATEHPAAVAVFSRKSSSNPKSDRRSEIKVADGSDVPAVSEEDHLALAKPLDFDMASKVEGQESQMVTFELQPGQVIRVSHLLLADAAVQDGERLNAPPSRLLLFCVWSGVAFFFFFAVRVCAFV